MFFDLCKAFDSIPHQALLNKLSLLNVPDVLLNWLKDYLYNRFQRVVLNDSNSELSHISSGVPQGSILGPLLFLAYINGISSLPFSPHTKLIMYADDFLLYKEISTSQDVPQSFSK